MDPGVHYQGPLPSPILTVQALCKITIFGLKMIVKSGLGKICLKFIHAGDYFFLLHKWEDFLHEITNSVIKIIHHKEFHFELVNHGWISHILCVKGSAEFSSLLSEIIRTFEYFFKSLPDYFYFHKSIHANN